MRETYEYLQRKNKMKNQYACALAALLLAAAFGAAIINNIYVGNTTEKMIDRLEALPSDPSEASPFIEKIDEEWHKERMFLDLTLPKPALDKISLLIDETKIAADQHSETDYKTAMARLRRAIEDIRDPERILLRNIF